MSKNEQLLDEYEDACITFASDMAFRDERKRAAEKAKELEKKILALMDDGDKYRGLCE